MTIFSVGQECPFKPQKMDYTILENGDIFFGVMGDNITEKMAHDFQFGNWWFSIRREQDHIMFLAKNKANEPQADTLMMEFAFSLNKVGKEHWEKFLSLEVGEAYPVHFMLIERKTNIIRALRMFGLSRRANQFMKSVFTEQSKQEPKPLNPAVLPTLRKSFDSGLIKEKAGTR